MKQKYFRNCYKILGLSDRRNITDEMVLEAYNNLKKQLEGFRKRAKTEDEIRRLQELEISINDAYRMLQTEEKRKIYDEFLEESERRKNNTDSENPSKTIKKGDSIKFTPIHKEQMITSQKNANKEDDDAR